MNGFANLRFTWLGHATFLFDTPGGRRVMVDPWIRTNPSTPDSARRIGHLDLMLVTHGHEDHTADVVPMARDSSAEVVAPYELASWLRQKGLKRVTGMNLGGTLAVLGLTVTMVPAFHSSSIEEEGRTVHLGSAAGYVIGFEDGTTIYFAGDTAVFGDMRLIGELYRPAVAFLPIGDLYTMGPEQAAKACELIGVRQVVPMHYGTFPALTGTPARLRELVEPRGVRLVEPIAGEPIALSRL